VKQAKIYRAILIIGTCFFFGSVATTALAADCAEDVGGGVCGDSGGICPGGGVHECDNVCGLPCGAGELEIAITDATCTGGGSVNCGMGCTGGNLLGKATISFTDGANVCPNREDVVVCQQWVHCDSGDVLCSSCGVLPTLTPPGDTEDVNLDCAGDPGEEYQYQVLLGDWDGFTYSACNTSDANGACGRAGNCDQAGFAGSCCVKAP